MRPQEYLDWVIDYYRAECPGITDAAIYELMVQELGAAAGCTLLMADRLGAELTIAPPALAVDKPSDPFYQSFEWRRVRILVIERDGAKCCRCGRSAQHGIVINVDHIRPRKRFPELALDPKNLQVLCDECNHGKGNLLFNSDWRGTHGTSPQP